MSWLAACIGFAVSIYIAVESVLALFTALRYGPEVARLRYAGVVVAAMGFLLAASLVKSLEILDWNTLGIFAAIFVLRSWIKFVLASEAKTPPSVATWPPSRR
jgi:hypothetical protein